MPVLIWVELNSQFLVSFLDVCLRGGLSEPHNSIIVLLFGLLLLGSQLFDLLLEVAGRVHLLDFAVVLDSTRVVLPLSVHLGSSDQRLGVFGVEL